MKRVVDVLYGLKGYANATKFAEFKTDLFANGATPAITMDTATTNGITVSGATTTAIRVTGTATTAFACLTGTFGTGLSLAGTLTTGINIGACTTGITIVGNVTTGVNLTGNATSAFKITSGTVTNAIELAAVANVTNFVKFNAASGCILNVDVNPKDVPSTGGLGADACIRIAIGTADYFIPIFAVELS
jgi:hypothetical protein